MSHNILLFKIFIEPSIAPFRYLSSPCLPSAVQPRASEATTFYFGDVQACRLPSFKCPKLAKIRCSRPKPTRTTHTLYNSYHAPQHSAFQSFQSCRFAVGYPIAYRPRHSHEPLKPQHSNLRTFKPAVCHTSKLPAHTTRTLCGSSHAPQQFNF